MANRPRVDPFIENMKANEARFVQAFLAQGQAAQAVKVKEQQRKQQVEDAIAIFKEKHKIMAETGGTKAAKKITGNDISEIGTTLLEQAEVDVPKTNIGELGGLAGVLERNMPFAGKARQAEQGKFDAQRDSKVNQLVAERLKPFLKQQLSQFMPGGQRPDQSANNILGNASPPAMVPGQGASAAQPVMAPSGPGTAPIQAQPAPRMQSSKFMPPPQDDALPDPSTFKPGSVIETDDGTRYKVEKGKWVKQ